MWLDDPFYWFVFQLLLIDKKLQEVHAVLSQAGGLIEAMVSQHQLQKESLKVYFLVLQVCHYLMAGQVCYHHRYYYWWHQQHQHLLELGICHWQHTNLSKVHIFSASDGLSLIMFIRRLTNSHLSWKNCQFDSNRICVICLYLWHYVFDTITEWSDVHFEAASADLKY